MNNYRALTEVRFLEITLLASKIIPSNYKIPCGHNRAALGVGRIWIQIQILFSPSSLMLNDTLSI
jgi:hypothetical protein